MKYLKMLCVMASSSLILLACNNNTQTNKSKSKEVNAPDTTIVSNESTPNTNSQIYQKQEVPVLCYHRIENGRNDEYTVSPSSFDNQMKALADSGYKSILPNQLYNYLVYNQTLPAKPILITFDDSRVEHSTIAAPILEKYGFKGVFFIMTITYNKKNYMTTEQIASLAKGGHTIGLHSWDHTMLTKYKDDDWQKEVVAPAKKLSEITSKPVEYWAHPYGIYNHQSTVELSKYMKMSFSLSTKRDSLLPLQCVRRMIVPEWSNQGMIRAMKRTFKIKDQNANKQI